MLSRVEHIASFPGLTEGLATFAKHLNTLIPDLNFRIVFVYHCECNYTRRKWLMLTSDTEHIFKDAADIGEYKDVQDVSNT